MVTHEEVYGLYFQPFSLNPEPKILSESDFFKRGYISKQVGYTHISKSDEDLINDFKEEFLLRMLPNFFSGAFGSFVKRYDMSVSL